MSSVDIDDQAVRRERIRLKREARKKRERQEDSPLQEPTAAPHNQPQMLTPPAGTNSPVANNTQRKKSRLEAKLQRFQQVLSNISDVNTRETAQAFIASLSASHKSLKQKISEHRETKDDISESDDEYHFRKTFHSRQHSDLVALQANVIEQINELINGNIPQNIGTVADKRIGEINGKIELWNNAEKDHEIKLMSLRTDRARAAQGRQLAIQQGPQTSQYLPAQSSFLEQARERAAAEQLLREQELQRAALFEEYRRASALESMPVGPDYLTPGVSEAWGIPGRVVPLPPLSQPPVYPADPDNYVAPVDVGEPEDIDSMIDHAHTDIKPADLPKELNVSQLEHQRQGLAWLLHQEKSKHQGGILADDMGLGKTVQTIALMYANPPAENLPEKEKMTLVVCPLSLIETWRKELTRRVHSQYHYTVYVHNNNYNARVVRQPGDIARGTRVVITTYETLGSEYSAQVKEDRSKPTPLLKVKWHRVVLDEAHLIKNFKSQRSLACAQLQATYRLCLSGTPMQNSLEELWPLLRFLRIKPYANDKRIFKAMLPAKNRNTYDIETNVDEKMRKLHLLIASILLRRTKDTEVNGVKILAELPQKTTYEINLSLEPTELASYVAFEDAVKNQAQQYLEESEGIQLFSNMLVLLLRLRQRSCHPMLMKMGLESWTPTPPKMNESDVENALAMDRSAVEMALNATGDNEVSEGDYSNKDLFRKCTACLEPVPYDVTCVLDPCGHTTCFECFNNLARDYPADIPGAGKCPVCERVVAGNIYLLLLKYASRHRHAPASNILRMYDERRKNLRARFAELKAEKQAALKRLLNSSNPQQNEFGFDFSDSEDEKADFDETKKEQIGARDETVKGEPVHAGTTKHQSNLFAGQDMTRDDLGMSRLHLAGATLRAAVQARYKVSIDEVAKLFHRSKCFKDGWHPGTKCDAIIETLTDVWQEAPHDKVIVFSFFTSFLDLLSIPLDAAGIQYLKYTGELDPVERNQVLQKFSTSSTKVLLISLRCGNVGLTLTDANRVFIVEPFWNPYVEEQAKDRVHRIGQRKEVKVYRFICSETVEDRIVELQEKKKEMIESALSKEARENVSKLTKNDLLFALGIRRNQRE